VDWDNCSNLDLHRDVVLLSKVADGPRP